MNLVWVPAMVGLLVVACSRNAPNPADVDPKALDSAPPQVKQAWSSALEAAGRNDYAQAIASLRTLSRQGLAPEQGKTVYDAIVVYETKLRDAAKKGDVAAQKAMLSLGISASGSR